MGFVSGDVKQALRMFRRNPGFPATVVAALALGIGTNTAVFSVYNAVLLRPVAAPDPDRIVVFLATNQSGTGDLASEIKFNLWREQTDVFEDVSGYATMWTNLTGVERPQMVDGALVTADYFRLYGLTPERGRTFTAEEVRGDARMVMLGDGCWRRTFGGDPGIVGRKISLDGLPYTVIGVVPGTATEARTPPEVWLPMPIAPASNSQVHYFQATARLKPGVSLAMANARLLAATEEFRRRYPGALSTTRRDVFSAAPLRDVLVKDARKTLAALAGAVSFVLLIACANVANLLLARGGARSREIAIRAAVGASRGRIVRQLLTESGLLALAGAVAGLAVGMAGMQAMLRLDGSRLPRLGLHGANVTLDWRVGLFTAAVTVATAALFGLLPALEGSRADLHSGLKAGGARAGGGRRANRTRSLLVVGEVSVALVSLIGAVLLIRTLMALDAVNPGFDAHNVVATMAALDPRFAGTKGTDPIAENIIRRIDALPGVEETALTGLLPLQGNFNSLTITIPGRPLVGLAHGNARWMTVSPAYFDLLRMRLLRGRVFTEQDKRDAAPVAIINQAMARQLWPDGDPLRDRLEIGKGLGRDFGEPVRQIVGIVSDVRDDSLSTPPAAAVFVPAAQRADRSATNPLAVMNLWVVVRTRKGTNAALNAAIENEVRRVTGNLPVPPVRRMEEVVGQSTSAESFRMILMSVFGACSVLLAAIGIYALLAHSVEQRRREMGVRIALGARPAAVRRMVVLEGLRLAAIGAALGMAAASVLTRWIGSFLYGVRPADPVSFVAAPLFLVGVALAAAWVPALRASRVDPAHALRSE